MNLFESLNSIMEADISMAPLKSNSISELISSSPEAGWSEYHPKTDMSTNMEDIKMPIEGNAFWIFYSNYTNNAAECIARFISLLHSMDDIRVFSTQMNSYFVVTKIEEDEVCRIWELISTSYGYKF